VNGAAGVVADPLFVAMTRPAMAWGVPYSALVVNAMVTIELFVSAKNLVLLLVCVPVHGLFWLLCLREPRFFELAQLWGRTRGGSVLGNLLFWGANSYSPLTTDVSDGRGRRRARHVQVMM
jgi:type IV secretion system protein VirB3